MTIPTVEKFRARIGTTMMSLVLFLLVIEYTIEFVKMQSENEVIYGNRK